MIEKTLEREGQTILTQKNVSYLVTHFCDAFDIDFSKLERPMQLLIMEISKQLLVSDELAAHAIKCEHKMLDDFKGPLLKELNDAMGGFSVIKMRPL